MSLFRTIELYLEIRMLRSMDAAVLPGSKQAVCSVFPLLGCSWASRFVQD